MTWYTFLLWVHVTCAAVWVGGGLMMQFFGVRAFAADDPEREAAFGQDVEWIGMRVFTAASLLLIVSAVLLMIEGDLEWGRMWIELSLLVWIASFLSGILFFGPESGRLGAVAQAEGPRSPVFLRRRARLIALTRVELTALFLVVFLMSVKPDWDDVGAVVLGLAIVVLGLAYSWRDYGRMATPATG